MSSIYINICRGIILLVRFLPMDLKKTIIRLKISNAHLLNYLVNWYSSWLCKNSKDLQGQTQIFDGSISIRSAKRMDEFLTRFLYRSRIKLTTDILDSSILLVGRWRCLIVYFFFFLFFKRKFVVQISSRHITWFACFTLALVPLPNLYGYKLTCIY